MQASDRLPDPAGNPVIQPFLPGGASVLGNWNAGADFNMSITWTLEQTAVASVFNVSIRYCGQEILNLFLDGSAASPTPFSVGPESSDGSTVYGSIQVTLVNGDTASVLSLLAEVSRVFAPPTNPQVLAVYSYPTLAPPSAVK